MTELAFLAYINQPITAMDCAVQEDGFVVPHSKALHDETVNSIAHYAPHNLEDVFDSRGARTGVGVIVYGAGEKAPKTGFAWLLYKDIAVIGLSGYGSKP